MLSDTAEYALRAALYLARREEEGPVPAATVAEELEIPGNYLSKVLQRLARAGVLESTRGPAGGFRLARPAEEVSLERTIGPFHAFDLSGRCLLSRRRCSEREPCVAHERWRAVVGEFRDFLAETSLAELLREEADRAARSGEAPAPREGRRPEATRTTTEGRADS